MSNKKIKLYNMIFPIWSLWFFPFVWFITLPFNFIIDLLVVYLGLRFLKIEESFKKTNSVILKVWIFGFLADFIGASFLFIVGNLNDFIHLSKSTSKWYSKNITFPIGYNPFENIYAFILTTISLVIIGFLIYIFNYKICFKKMQVDEIIKKKLAIILAVVTTPYMFYIPLKYFF